MDGQPAPRTGDPDLRVELPADPSFLPLVRMLVGALAGQLFGTDDARAGGLRLAASELCDAVIAGVSGDPSQRIELRARPADGHIELWLRAARPTDAWDLTLVAPLVASIDVVDDLDARVAHVVVGDLQPGPSARGS